MNVDLRDRGASLTHFQGWRSEGCDTGQHTHHDSVISQRGSRGRSWLFLPSQCSQSWAHRVEGPIGRVLRPWCSPPLLGTHTGSKWHQAKQRILYCSFSFQITEIRLLLSSKTLISNCGGLLWVLLKSHLPYTVVTDYSKNLVFPHLMYLSIYLRVDMPWKVSGWLKENQTQVFLWSSEAFGSDFKSSPGYPNGFLHT